MVIKYFGPNDKTGVYWPPYTAVEKRQMEADLYRKPHAGLTRSSIRTNAAKGLACLGATCPCNCRHQSSYWGNEPTGCGGSAASAGDTGDSDD